MHKLSASATRGLTLSFNVLSLSCLCRNPWLFCAITYSASTATWKVMHGSTAEVGFFSSKAWTALLYCLKAEHWFSNQ